MKATANIRGDTRTALMIAAVISLWTLCAPAALAVEGHLQGLGESEVVFVWRDKASQEEGISLIGAGVHQSNPAMVLGLLSCAPQSGTRAVTTSAGFVTHDILVIEGPDTGCRGNVPMESFKSK